MICVAAITVREDQMMQTKMVTSICAFIADSDGEVIERINKLKITGDSALAHVQQLVLERGVELRFVVNMKLNTIPPVGE